MLPGPGALTDWKEFDNKIEAFRLFQYPEREVGDPLREGAVAMALRQPDFRAIWVLEGIAHERAARSPAGRTEILPDRTGVAIHAGMGTALAERYLSGLGKEPGPEDIRGAIEEFAAAAKARCRPGWEPAALEPFGLVVRGLHPQLLRPVSEAMPSEEMRSLYWHGAGRSSYFAPTGFIPVPGAHGRMLRTAMEDAPDENARLNMIAGLVWAGVLVNLPHPKVAASFAEACAEHKLEAGFRNGLLSALMSWQHMAPLDGTLLRVYTSPDPPNGISRTLWKTWIAEPAARAMAEIYPGINRAGRIGQLFRYRTAEELAELARE